MLTMLTKKQRKLLRVFEKTGTVTKTAQILGVSHQYVSKELQRIQEREILHTQNNKRFLVMSDAHFPYHHRDTFRFYKAVKDAYQITDVKHAGDLVDNHMMSYHEYETDALGPREEYSRARECLQELEETFPEMTISLGNHCFTPDTEIFTQRGWVSATDVREGDTVLSLNEEENTRWSLVDKVHCLSHEGDMLEWNTAISSLKVTPDHRIYHKPHGKYKGPMRISYAKDIAPSFSLPCAGMNDSKGIEVSDTEIRLWGWLMTDSYHQSDTRAVLYQRASNAHKIREVLDELKVSYREETRERDIRQICGKELKKPCEDAVEFYLKHETFIVSNKRLDKRVFELSQRQFKVLLETLIEADGTDYSQFKGNRIGWVFYGKKEICGDVQGLCIRNGYRATMSEPREGQFVVNIHPSRYTNISGGTAHWKPYKGDVYCLTTLHGNFLVRRGGKAHFTGNCSLNARKAKTAGIPLDFLREYNDLYGLKGKWKWVDDELFDMGNGQMCYLTHSVAANTRVNAYKFSHCSVQGHHHGEFCISYYADQLSLRWAMSVGCTIDHHAPAMRYGSNNRNKKPILGCGVIIKGMPHLIPMKLQQGGGWDGKLPVLD